MKSKTKSVMFKVSYTNTVGCLMYFMLSTRPDFSHAISVISRNMEDP